MQETGNKISLATRITGDSFLSSRTGSYDLYIFINDHEISCAVADKRNHVYVALESWELIKEYSYAEAIKIVIGESELLNASNYRRIICCSGFRSSVFVPDALFDTENFHHHLNFAVPSRGKEEVMFDDMPLVRAKNIFSIPSEVFEILLHHFHEIQCFHTATALTGHILANHQNQDDHIITLNIHRNYFEALVTSGKSLLFYNSFDYHSAEELVYHILFVCEQLHLNPESVTVVLAGNILKEDANYKLIYKYIRNVSLSERPDSYTYDSGFESLPSQFHFNLFSQLVCAS